MIAELAAALAALEPVAGAAEGEPVALDGGMTNRNFRLRLGGRDVVVRLPGQGHRAARHRPHRRARGDRGGGAARASGPR